MENRNKLPVNIPNKVGIILADRTKLVAINENEFIWEGSFPNDEGSIFINATGEVIFGRIKYQDATYSIEAIGKSKSLFLLHNNDIFTPDECGTDHSSHDHSRDMKLEPRTHCEDLPIRVGVLFTQAAHNTGLNMINIAITAISDLNTILSNSNITNHDARFQLSGLQLLQGFNETNWRDDIDALPNNEAAQNFRNQTLSDVVVLLTNGNYFGVLGIANQIGAADENAYAIVQANTANANYTFGHEVVHLIGGRHQQCNLFFIGGCDDTPGFRHGFAYQTGFWPFINNKTTLLYQLRNGFSRQRELSFPPTKGTAFGNDNARMMRENACAVSQFRLNPLSISITGPSCLPSTTTGTWCVNISNCPNV